MMGGRRDYDHLCGKFRVSRATSAAATIVSTRDSFSVVSSSLSGRQQRGAAGAEIVTGVLGSVLTGYESREVGAGTKRSLLEKGRDGEGMPITEEASTMRTATHGIIHQPESITRSTVSLSGPSTAAGSTQGISITGSTQQPALSTADGHPATDDSTTTDSTSLLLKIQQNLYSSNITPGASAPAKMEDPKRAAWSSVGPLKTQFELSSRFKAVDESQIWRGKDGINFQQYVLSFPPAANAMEASASQGSAEPMPPASSLMSKFRGIEPLERKRLPKLQAGSRKKTAKVQKKITR